MTARTRSNSKSLPAVPAARVRTLNDAPLDARGSYVVYWSTAFRRTRFNFALQHAVHMAMELGVGLVTLEGLRCDYPFASDRLHAFVLQGMQDNASAYEKAGVRYLPYVEPGPHAGRGMIETLAARAALIVADDYPAFGLPYWLAAAASSLAVRCDAVDANGLLPMRSTDREFTTAASFRRHLQKELPQHLTAFPVEDPLRALRSGERAVLPATLSNWKLARASELADPRPLLARLPIDHEVTPTATPGGAHAADARLDAFLDADLGSYHEKRNDPAQSGTSGLSPYLHFGHIGVHEIFSKLAGREGWYAEQIGPVTGSREGWWGMGEGAEAFLDELVTWREIGFNLAWQRPDANEYDSLPDWARKTLGDHANDPRASIYDENELERAETHDEIWNAAQRELIRDGRIHGYLRMLWGKKILEWSPSPREAHRILFQLNDRYALDGRDPNSISGISWVLGRYDRAWGPERPIFGKIRYMSSENTARKLQLGPYLEEFGDGAQPTLL